MENIGRAYIGSIIGLEFNLERLIEYRNGFLPIIHGKIIGSSNGSTVSLSLEMKKPTFFIVTIAPLVAILVCGLIILIKGTLFPLIVLFAFLGYSVLGLLIFYNGVKTSRNHFIQITKGKIKSVTNRP